MNAKPLSFKFFNNQPGIALSDEQADIEDELKSEDESYIMRGHATLYDVKTDLYLFTMSIDRNAFKDSIERGDEVVSLFNHNLDLLLGRTPNTLHLEWDKEKGLYTETNLPEHSVGQLVLESLKRGDLNQMSVGFNVRAHEVTEKEGETPHIHVLQADLFDISVVTFAQIPETDVDVARGTLSAAISTEDTLKTLLQSHKEEDELKNSMEGLTEVLRLKSAHRKKLEKNIYDV